MTARPIRADPGPGASSAAVAAYPGAQGSQEAELFLLCGRPDPDPGARQRIQALVDRSLDWNWIMAQADRHEVGSLL
ncbi:MAG: hypothetical protein ACRDRT_19480 [Pseudonocardiaceae bacterium]